VLIPVSIPSNQIEKFAKQALRLAKLVEKTNEVPVAAIVVLNGKIISTGVNRIVKTRDPTAHAEILAIRRAAKKIKNERLLNCELITTLEPCVMCTGAAILARVKRIYYCATESKSPGSKKILSSFKFNHTPELIHLKDLQEEAAELLTDFFSKRRRK
jgi:tRNA(adenine34) deaminase